MFNGKIHYKWPFSIAMLNYQRVSHKNLWSFGVSVESREPSKDTIITPAMVGGQDGQAVTLWL